MKTLKLDESTYKALVNTAEKNFRTVDLQIAYWLSSEERAPVHTAKRKVEGGKPGWSAAKRAAQAERMKKMWADGAIRRRKKASDPVDLGHVNFDD